jgi:DNA repair photolyase
METKEFKSFYKTVGGNEGSLCHYPTRLDTYGCGCSHDCKYCYAKSLLEFRGLWNPDNPSVADIEKIRKKVSKLPKGTTLRLGGMTDCFQPVERKHNVTYETIKILNEYGIHYLIVTKSDLVADDKYIEVMDKNLAHIQISITTTDDDLSLQYEKATVPSKRIEAIEKLQNHGFDVSVRLSPYIPDLVDIDIINQIKCDKILIEFLRVNTWVNRWFSDIADLSKHTLKKGGYRHLPLEVKKDYISKIKNFKEMSVCEDVEEHYHYWEENFNHNPKDCCNLRKTIE